MTEEQAAPVDNVTLALVDVPDAAELARALPAPTAEALRQLDALVHRLAYSHGGYAATPDDARARIAFHDAPDALHFAVDLQRLLLQVPWPDALLATSQAASELPLWRGLRARIALHTGRPEVRAEIRTGRMRYFGAMPRVGQAVLEAAHPGQIVASGTTFAHLQAWLGDVMVHRVLGRFALDKGVPVILVELLPGELVARDLPLPVAYRLPDGALSADLQADVMDHALLAVGQALREGEA